LPEFKNPNQGASGSDSRGLLVMVVVFFAAMMGVRFFMAKNQPATPPAQTAPAQTANAAAPQPGSAMMAMTAMTPAVQATAESTTVIENELYKITFSNRGGVVTSWILKNFKTIGGQPLDMVHAGASKAFGYPLSLYTYDAGLTKTLSEAMFVPSATGSLQSPATLSFDYSAGGLKVHKTFTFGADYVIHAESTVERDGAPVRALLSWPAGFGDQETFGAFPSTYVDTSTNGKDEHIVFKNVVGGATLNGPLDFAGTSDQYFAAIFMPDQPGDATMATLHNELGFDFHGNAAAPIPHDVKTYFVTTNGKEQHFQATKGGPDVTFAKPPQVLPIIGSAVGNASGHDSLRLFVGPKSIKVLKSIHTQDGHDLGPVLDFGFWGPISKILFLGIQFVHTHIASNWGWAIIIFTILINLVVLPLRVQGMKAAMKMQRLQPQIDAIKARYGNPGPTSPKMAEMNAEVMALQKANGVSMFGGCIPTLIQFPLLIAFFYMMTRVVELRQAHWFYLHDLSQPDPWHILPILMVATSFLAQYYTPSPGVDPQQQKMMAFMMPAFSGWMTWNYASGLALYWNVGNFIMIIQQQIMNRTKMGREMKEIAAKRAQARIITQKSPKTIQGKR